MRSATACSLIRTLVHVSEKEPCRYCFVHRPRAGVPLSCRSAWNMCRPCCCHASPTLMKVGRTLLFSSFSISVAVALSLPAATGRAAPPTHSNPSAPPSARLLRWVVVRAGSRRCPAARHYASSSPSPPRAPLGEPSCFGRPPLAPALLPLPAIARACYYLPCSGPFGLASHHGCPPSPKFIMHEEPRSNSLHSLVPKVHSLPL